jgi:hypothetical protein
LPGGQDHLGPYDHRALRGASAHQLLQPFPGLPIEPHSVLRYSTSHSLTGLLMARSYYCAPKESQRVYLIISMVGIFRSRLPQHRTGFLCWRSTGPLAA